MAWTESGLYAATLGTILANTAATVSWTATTNKFYLTNNSDTPSFNAAQASAIYSATNECTGTGWAAGGIAVSALAAGSTSLAPAFTVTGPSPSAVNLTASNVSVATTTLAAVSGGYFYSTAFSNYLILGLWFGGSVYATFAGTFAINWSGGIIASITCAVT